MACDWAESIQMHRNRMGLGCFEDNPSAVFDLPAAESQRYAGFRTWRRTPDWCDRRLGGRDRRPTSTVSLIMGYSLQCAAARGHADAFGQLGIDSAFDLNRMVVVITNSMHFRFYGFSR